MGIFLAYSLIPALPEMVESALPYYPGHEGLVNDLSSGIFAAFFGIGQMLAPTYGSYMTAAYNFRITCDVMAITVFTFGVIYFLFGSGVQAFKTTYRNLKRSESSFARAQEPRFAALTSHTSFYYFAQRNIKRARKAQDDSFFYKPE